VSFCKLMLGALDDFMLKLLLVCACVSIAIDVGFADPHERSHGNIKEIDYFSLDWRHGYLCCSIRGCFCWILERLLKRTLIYEALSFKR